jgi:serine phosphatase RsbU (regulator of sigma subunit)
LVALTVFLAGAPLAAFIAFSRADPDPHKRFMLLGFAALFALMLAIGLAFQILSFIRALETAANQWQSGNFDHRITPGQLWSADFRKLAQAENEMAERVYSLYSREREIAQTLQSMLVSPLPSRFGPLQLADYYQPGSFSADIGGDFYSLFHLPEGRIGLVFGDIGGRGLGAAVKIAALRYAIEGFARSGMKPEEVVGLANQIVLERSLEAFVTVVYLVVDPTAHCVEIVNAGHEPLLFWSAESRAWTPLQNDQPALGVLPGASYHPISLRLNPHDLVMLYTDGVASVGPKKGEWSTDDLLRQVGRLAAVPDELVEGISHALPKGKDDAAIVCFRYRCE